VTLTSLDVLVYTITFLVPGYVLYSTLVLFGRHRPVDTQLAFLQFLTLGALHNAPWAAVVYLLFRRHLHHEADARAYFGAHAFWAATGWLFVVLVSPMIAAILYLRVRRSELLSDFALRLVGQRPLALDETAWDFGFARGWLGLYVGVTLTDGSIVYGKFGSRSKATSAVSGKDLHLEEVWNVDAQGAWSQPDGPVSVTISGNTIQTITFWGEPLDGEDLPA
jgi:hypothetical protein